MALRVSREVRRAVFWPVLSAFGSLAMSTFVGGGVGFSVRLKKKKRETYPLQKGVLEDIISMGRV